MEGSGYFQRALSAFTHDVASGGAIRHLTDLGYTARQIKEQLAFPTPYERVRETMREHLLDRKILLEEEPGCGKEREMAEYVLEHDRYGRTSFRKLPLSSGASRAIQWQEGHFKGTEEELAAFLEERCRLCGEETSYVSCDLGLQSKKDPAGFARTLSLLEEGQREYVLGVFWVRKRVYHRLDERMRKIVARLYGAGVYDGICYFAEQAEKIIF